MTGFDVIFCARCKKEAASVWGGKQHKTERVKNHSNTSIQKAETAKKKKKEKGLKDDTALFALANNKICVQLFK